VSNYKISRRQFMTASGAIFTLPLLESLFTNKALAQAAGDPKRYVLFYWPNGTYNRPDKPIWETRVGDLNAGNTSIALTPFASNYSEIVSINYLNNSAWHAMQKLYNDEHAAQASSYINCSDVMNSTTTSFEHVIADKVGKPALVLSGGVTSADLPADRYISYRNGVGNPGIGNPGDLYRQLLKQVVPTTGTPTPAPVDNTKSVLDSAIADFNSFNSKLGKADKAKMEEFLTAVRELESKVIETAPPGGVIVTGACVKPTINPALDNTNSKDSTLYLAKFYAMNDMIKIAFACDLTRSVSIMVDTETSQRTWAKPPTHLMYQGADISGGYGSHTAISHGIIHTAGYNLAATRDRVLMNVLIDLAEKLKTSRDPSGSRMLDNTIIQGGFGVADGYHGLHREQRPLVLVGGRNMITGGKSHKLSAYQMKDLLYTISYKMGVGLPNFKGSNKIVPL